MFKKSKLPLYFLLELYIKKNITFSYNETITNTVDFKKIKKDSDKLKELKLQNWEMVKTLEKISNPQEYIEKLSKTHISKDIFNKVNNLYKSLDFFAVEDNLIIEELEIKIKELSIFNEWDIINHIQENIEDYKKVNKNYVIKSIFDRKTNIKTSNDYELLEPLTNKELMIEFWDIEE